MIATTSCSPIKQTTPNLSTIDPTYKSTHSEETENLGKARNLFIGLSTLNSTLANEIEKLPDLQDGISSDEINAIEKLIQLNNLKPDYFNEAFKEMNKIGKGEFRKYCVPLQALFWLAQKYTIEELEKLEFKETIGLLNKAWNFSDKTRWADPQKVIDRLNSPELFEVWFASNFTYDWSKFYITTRTASPQTAEITIKTKKGICFDAAFLAYTCLKRAGYDVTGLNVYFRTKTRVGSIMHSVCILKMQWADKISYYKIADTMSPGFVFGPFDSIEAIAEYIARMHGVALKIYTTGVPSYHYDLFR